MFGDIREFEVVKVAWSKPLNHPYVVEYHNILEFERNHTLLILGVNTMSEITIVLLRTLMEKSGGKMALPKFLLR